jgi:hypothetical protein
VKHDIPEKLLSEKVKRKRRIVNVGIKSGTSGSQIQRDVRTEHANARRPVVKKFMSGPVGAEVGVDWGDFAKVVIEVSSPQKYYLIDPWDNNPKSRVDRVKKIFREQTDDGSVVVIEKTGEKAARQIPDDSLDWAYIDCAHKQREVVENLIAYLPKVKVGGYLIGDDYNTLLIKVKDNAWAERGSRVARGFQDFIEQHKDQVEIVYEDAHGECQVVLQKIK